MGIKTSAKFDKNVRDAKDAIIEFCDENRDGIITVVLLGGIYAVAFIWEKVGYNIGYNVGYSRAILDITLQSQVK